MARSLNKVQLIGRLGADPESKVTGSGIQVATFSLATNRQWTSKDGSPQEETDWHNIVAWERLAQICHDHLTKGRLVYIEGRLHTRTYETNGQKQYRTEIVASDMLMLDSAHGAEAGREEPPARNARQTAAQVAANGSVGRGRPASVIEGDLEPDDIPF